MQIVSSQVAVDMMAAVFFNHNQLKEEICFPYYAHFQFR